MTSKDMTVTEFLMLLWEHKVKVGVLLLALIFGPGLYEDWTKHRAAEKLEADRNSVDTEASIAGMTLWNAWRGCSEIGIVNDMERCAAYRGRLIQEQAAPMMAKMAIEHRNDFYKTCQRFYAQEYCGQLLQRSIELSRAQGKRSSE